MRPLTCSKTSVVIGATPEAPDGLLLPDHLVAQHPDVVELNLYGVAVLHIKGLAFGSHPQHIARVEIDCMLAEVLTRLQDIELTEPPEWLASNFISGIRRMPIRFTPGKSG